MLQVLNSQADIPVQFPGLSGPAVSEIAPLARDRSIPSSVPYIRGGLPPQVHRRVLDYVSANLNQDISNSDLARVAGMSASNFVRAFRQSQGDSPHRYLMQRRIERTQQLLADTDLPISEIALAVGFSDQSHCCRCFREIVGVTPRIYRWSMR